MKNKNGTDPAINRHLLLIDDDEDDYVIMHNMLREIQRESYHLTWAATYDDGLQKLHTSAWDAILVDYDLGSGNGIDFIREAIQRGYNEPCIMVTGRGSYELDRDAMTAGAYDYISKQALSPSLLERAIRYAIERHHVEEHLETLVNQRTAELQSAMEELSTVNEELKVQADEILLFEKNDLIDFDLYRERQETFPSAYLVTDGKGVIHKADYGASLLFGTPIDHLMGHLLTAYVIVEERSRFARNLVYLTAEHPPYRWTFHLTRAGYLPFEAYLTVVRRDEDHEATLRWLIQCANAF